jgi:hypothetical protein
VSHQNFERILHFRVSPGSMFVSVSVNTKLFYLFDMTECEVSCFDKSFQMSITCVSCDLHNIKGCMILNSNVVC